MEVQCLTGIIIGTSSVTAAQQYRNTSIVLSSYSHLLDG